MSSEEAPSSLDATFAGKKFDQLLSFARDLAFADLPQHVVNCSKQLITDSIAVAIAAADAPGIGALLDQMREWSGRPQATVIFHGDRLPAAHAALVNASMIHALEYDDTHDEAGIHVNVCILSAILAAAERAGGIDGRDLIVAHTIGLEIACRLGRAVGKTINPGWHPTTIFGCLGAAIGVGRILRLSMSEMQSALGIAFAQLGGTRQALVDGALAKRIQPGVYAQAAVLAALLARRGITGSASTLVGTFGLHPIVGPSKISVAHLLESLGDRYEMTQISLKYFPASRSTHIPIEAAIQLATDEDIRCDDISTIDVYVANPAAVTALGRSFDPGPVPQVSAQFSIPYVVATALLRRAVSLRDFRHAAIILDRDTAELAKRVSTHANPGRSGEVEITTHDGRRLARRLTLPLGHPLRPMSREQLDSKFRQCTSNLAQHSESGLWELRSALEDLEALADITHLMSKTVATRSRLSSE